MYIYRLLTCFQRVSGTTSKKNLCTTVFLFRSDPRKIEKLAVISLRAGANVTLTNKRLYFLRRIGDSARLWRRAGVRDAAGGGGPGPRSDLRHDKEIPSPVPERSGEESRAPVVNVSDKRRETRSGGAASHVNTSGDISGLLKRGSHSRWGHGEEEVGLQCSPQGLENGRSDQKVGFVRWKERCLLF